MKNLKNKLYAVVHVQCDLQCPLKISEDWRFRFYDRHIVAISDDDSSQIDYTITSKCFQRVSSEVYVEFKMPVFDNVIAEFDKS